MEFEQDFMDKCRKEEKIMTTSDKSSAIKMTNDKVPQSKVFRFRYKEYADKESSDNK
jgi:hypothetical protein